MIRPTRVRRLKRRRALKATIVVVGMTASVLIVSSAWAKDVTLVIDGHSQELHTRSTSVEDLLTDQGVPLSIGLQVQPPPAQRCGRHDRCRESAAGCAGGRFRRRSPHRCGGLGGGATGRGSVWEGGSRDRGGFHLRGRCRTFGGHRASRCGGEGTDYRPTRERPGRSLRPWGSNPTLTIASSHHPAPPFTTG